MSGPRRFFEDDVPDEFLDFNSDRALFGPWLENKRPASVELRRHLSEKTRIIRAEILAADYVGDRREALQWLRGWHRGYAADLLKLEETGREVRKRFFKDLFEHFRFGGRVQ